MTAENSILVRLAPVIFVLLWATGFIGAKYGMQGAEPFTFLAIRFLLTFLILLPVIVWMFADELKKTAQLVHSFIAGCLIHGVYLGGVFYAIDNGMAAGLSALIVSLQPFFTVLFGFLLLGERISAQKMFWFVVALGGVLLVLSPNLGGALSVQGVTLINVLCCVLATGAISFGAVYQKRNVTNLNLLVSTFAQFTGAMVAVGLIAVLFEDGTIVWNRQVVLSMAWLVLVLSIGAVALLMFLIRQGSSNSVASLFFLVPVVSMFMAWVLFDEQLTPIQILASILVVASVGLASRIQTKKPA